MSTFDRSPVETPKRPGPPLGQVVFGVSLLVVGVAWLLTALDIATISWRAVLAALLVLVGVVLLALARTGAHGGLVAFGVALTVVLSLASTAEGVFDIPFEGGIGDRLDAPASLADHPGPYRLAIGKLTVDLTDTDLPAGESLIEASVLMGELEIRLAEGVAIDLRGRIGAGQVTINRGPEWSGTGIDQAFKDEDYADATVRLVVDARVGLGQIRVRR